jgi:MerR family transcriptional regulator, mercuric resistance operon regulatory protein
MSALPARTRVPGPSDDCGDSSDLTVMVMTVHPVVTTGSRLKTMKTITKTRAAPLTIGQLSDATGVNIETIRYYERINLLAAPPRTRGGHRSYREEHIKRLGFVRRARELGFGIGPIRALLALAEGDNPLCQDVRNIAAVHLADVRAKLADLLKLESILGETVAQCDIKCCGSPAPLCPVLEILQH